MTIRFISVIEDNSRRKAAKEIERGVIKEENILYSIMLVYTSLIKKIFSDL
jgi:hypothetical protein